MRGRGATIHEPGKPPREISAEEIAKRLRAMRVRHAQSFKSLGPARREIVRLQEESDEMEDLLTAVADAHDELGASIDWQHVFEPIREWLKTRQEDAIDRAREA